MAINELGDFGAFVEGQEYGRHFKHHIHITSPHAHRLRSFGEISTYSHAPQLEMLPAGTLHFLTFRLV
jgi:hypothetical protein